MEITGSSWVLTQKQKFVKIYKKKNNLQNKIMNPKYLVNLKIIQV